MEPRECPDCGAALVFSGYDDGGGDYGDSVCEVWDCPDCNYSEEGACIDGNLE